MSLEKMKIELAFLFLTGWMIQLVSCDVDLLNDFNRETDGGMIEAQPEVVFIGSLTRGNESQWLTTIWAPVFINPRYFGKNEFRNFSILMILDKELKKNNSDFTADSTAIIENAIGMSLEILQHFDYFTSEIDAAVDEGAVIETADNAEQNDAENRPKMLNLFDYLSPRSAEILEKGTDSTDLRSRNENDDIKAFENPDGVQVLVINVARSKEETDDAIQEESLGSEPELDEAKNEHLEEVLSSPLLPMSRELLEETGNLDRVASYDIEKDYQRIFDYFSRAMKNDVEKLSLVSIDISEDVVEKTEEDISSQEIKREKRTVENETANFEEMSQKALKKVVEIKREKRAVENETENFEDMSQKSSKNVVTVLIPIPDVIFTRSEISLEQNSNKNSSFGSKRPSLELEDQVTQTVQNNRVRLPFRISIPELFARRYGGKNFETGKKRFGSRLSLRRARDPSDFFKEISSRYKPKSKFRKREDVEG